MNEYTIESLQVGTEEAFTVTVTELMQDEFMRICGDVNPMHTDAEYAALRGYGGGRLVYGMLTASFLSALAGVYLPGRRCLLQECNVQFARPVYIGDELTVSGRVTQIDARFSRVAIRAQITNQRAEKVLRGKLLVGILED